jgi:hypothetical protein
MVGIEKLERFFAVFKLPSKMRYACIRMARNCLWKIYVALCAFMRFAGVDPKAVDEELNYLDWLCSHNSAGDECEGEELPF